MSKAYHPAIQMQTRQNHIFSRGEGEGFTLQDQAELPQHVRALGTEVRGEELQPGTATDLNGFFTRKVTYMGMLAEKNMGMVFYLGKSEDLLNCTHYHRIIYRLNAERLYVRYAQASGRDFIWRNGGWK